MRALSGPCCCWCWACVLHELQLTDLAQGWCGAAMSCCCRTRTFVGWDERGIPATLHSSRRLLLQSSKGLLLLKMSFLLLLPLLQVLMLQIPLLLLLLSATCRPPALTTTCVTVSLCM